MQPSKHGFLVNFEYVDRLSIPIEKQSEYQDIFSD